MQGFEDMGSKYDDTARISSKVCITFSKIHSFVECVFQNGKDDDDSDDDNDDDDNNYDGENSKNEVYRPLAKSIPF